MNIQFKKLEIVQLVLNTNKTSVLKEVEKVLKNKTKDDWWDEISEAEKQSIEQGLAEAERGETTPHSEVMKKVKEKYNLD